MNDLCRFGRCPRGTALGYEFCTDHLRFLRNPLVLKVGPVNLERRGLFNVVAELAVRTLKARSFGKS